MEQAPPRGRGRTVLLGWELGDGFGHVRPLARIAAALADLGCRPVLAVRDAFVPWAALRELPYPLLAAPYYAPAAGRPCRGMADVLGLHGYSSVHQLAPLVRVWDGLLALLDPALAVTDYAPTLALTAAGRVPVVAVGSGFTTPPTHLPEFPPFDPDQPPLFAEADLLAVVRQVQAARGGPVPDTFPAAFRPAAVCLKVVPELDPYRQYRTGGEYVGPLDAVPPPLPWPDGPLRFFAYLVAGVASTEPGLLALAAGGLAGETYIRGADDGLKGRLRAAGLTVHDAPVPLTAAFGRCGVLVHQGGLNTAQAALAAGRPQMVLPTHLEQRRNGVALFRLGAAHCLDGEYPADDLVEGVRQLLTVPHFRIRALELAGQFARSGWVDGLPAVVAACRRHLG